jgi:hypothetical protein
VTAFDRYFHGSYFALRPYLFGRLFLAMVALDTWMLMIGHAGRYGVAGFNVAHFAWLNALGPSPSPPLYVGVLLLTGLLALCGALLGTTPAAMTLLCGLYTYSWSMSMLDSYQHHYFVSLIMLCMVFFPRLRLRDALIDPAGAVGPRLVSGFGFCLLGASVTILYTFTAIAKMDAQWCRGFTLQRISRAGRVFAPLLAYGRELGLQDATFWSVVSTSVIPVELCIAAGYAVAVRQDASPHRVVRLVALITLFFALSLHLGAEALGLDIGWFSYYMLVLALTYLAPPRLYALLHRGALRASTWFDSPARPGAGSAAPKAAAAASKTAALSPGPAPRPLEALLFTAAVSSVLAATAYTIDLPGALAAAGCAAVGLWLVVLRALHHKRTSDARRSALGLGFAALLMWSAITASSVRWEFYRYLGGDLQRRGELREALDAYVKGERYAPKGSSRRDKIQQLQRELAR